MLDSTTWKTDGTFRAKIYQNRGAHLGLVHHALHCVDIGTELGRAGCGSCGDSETGLGTPWPQGFFAAVLYPPSGSFLPEARQVMMMTAWHWQSKRCD